VAEFLRWRQEGGSLHLILNLSLGWDGELFGDLAARRVADLDPPVRAVYGALRFAARRGVLVIAAAGNRRGGPQPSGWPLLPAAWELRRPSPWPFVPGPKLVYAVGGVDWQGLPLPNSRRGAMPRRVAYGDHAVTTVDGHPTSIYTGTSVSAAVVSSIAAVVWDLRPELRPDQVMKLVSRSGERLETRADFYAWDFWPLSRLLPRPQMRRASLCAAVKRACGPGGAQCSALASAPQCRPWKRQPPLLSSAVLAGITPPASPFTPTSLPSSFIPPCNPSMRLLTADGQVPAAPCPADQFGSVASQRWVMPQPEDDPCPGCTLLPKPPKAASLALEALSDGGGNLQDDTQLYALALEIGGTWRNAHPNVTLVSATLDIDRYVDGVFSTRLTYPISFDLTAGAPQTIDGLGDGYPLTGCTAQLNFVVQAADGTMMSLQNPVVVDP
jgi:Subtilase family